MHVGKINGKDIHADFTVIEGVSHMIRDSVMNGVYYDAQSFDELADYLSSTNANIPAPLSHPADANGNFMAAADPQAQAHNIQAFDSDWRVVGDRLVSNTYIRMDTAQANEDAGWLVERLNNKEPIDRSTGLYLNTIDEQGFGPDGDEYAERASNLILEHSALLNPDVEPGAKNNNDGVGMFTNARGDAEIIEHLLMNANACNPAMGPARYGR